MRVQKKIPFAQANSTTSSMHMAGVEPHFHALPSSPIAESGSISCTKNLGQARHLPCLHGATLLLVQIGGRLS